MPERPAVVVLDAWVVVVGFYDGEELAASEFERLLEADDTIAVMSAVNFAEVCSGLARVRGLASASRDTEWLRAYVALDPATTDMAETAARVELGFHMSLGDAFAAATALAYQAPLWIGDAELLCEDAPWLTTDLRHDERRQLHADQIASGTRHVGRRSSGPLARLDSDTLAEWGEPTEAEKARVAEILSSPGYSMQAAEAEHLSAGRELAAISVRDSVQ